MLTSRRESFCYRFGHREGFRRLGPWSGFKLSKEVPLFLINRIIEILYLIGFLEKMVSSWRIDSDLWGPYQITFSSITYYFIVFQIHSIPGVSKIPLYWHGWQCGWIATASETYGIWEWVLWYWVLWYLKTVVVVLGSM